VGVHHRVAGRLHLSQLASAQNHVIIYMHCMWLLSTFITFYYQIKTVFYLLLSSVTLIQRAHNFRTKFSRCAIISGKSRHYVANYRTFLVDSHSHIEYVLFQMLFIVDE